MKLNLNVKSLLKDRNVLYAVFFIAITNLFALLMFRQFEAILFFLIVGLLTSYFSKNMIIIMLAALLSTNFLIGTKLLGNAVKEGMGTKEPVKEDKPVSEEDKPISVVPPVKATATAKLPAKPKKTDEKFSTLSPASVREGEFIDTKVDYASTLEAAYDNLDKLLGSDAIRTMTEDTHRLAEKQKVLMGNIKQLQPMMQTAGKMLDGLNVGQMSDMLTGLEDKFKKFSGGAGLMK